MSIKNRIREFVTEVDATTASEYAVMLALIILAALGGITLLGAKASSVFTSVKNSMPTGQ